MSAETQLYIPGLEQIALKPPSPLEILIGADKFTLDGLLKQPEYKTLLSDLGATHVLFDRSRIVVPTEMPGIRITVTAIDNILAKSEGKLVDKRPAFRALHEITIYHGTYSSTRNLPEGTRIASHGGFKTLNKPHKAK